MATYEDDFAYWTLERIKNATPADRFLRKSLELYEQTSDRPEGEVSGVGTGNFSKVHVVKELKATPYQSIGRLYVHGEHTDATGTITECDRYATAFYIGNSTILTVGHAFKIVSETGDCTFQETHGGIFIPASQSESDGGEHFGKFLFRSGRRGGYFLHPDYDPQHRCPEHDICKVSLCKGMTEGGVLIKSIEDVNLQPLMILKNQKYAKTAWRAYGYPHGFDEIMNLVGVRGTYQSCDNKKVVMSTKAEVLPGMSGGPWILDDEDQRYANGIQAGNPVGIGSSAVSPYFSDELFDKLGI